MRLKSVLIRLVHRVLEAIRTQWKTKLPRTPRSPLRYRLIFPLRVHDPSVA